MLSLLAFYGIPRRLPRIPLWHPRDFFASPAPETPFRAPHGALGQNAFPVC